MVRGRGPLNVVLKKLFDFGHCALFLNITLIYFKNDHSRCFNVQLLKTGKLEGRGPKCCNFVRCPPPSPARYATDMNPSGNMDPSLVFELY